MSHAVTDQADWTPDRLWLRQAHSLARMSMARTIALAVLLSLLVAVGSIALVAGSRWIGAAGLLGLILYGGTLRVRAALPNASPGLRAVVPTLLLALELMVTLGVAVWARRHQDLPLPLAVGFLAFSGGLMLSYSRARILASAGVDLPDGPSGLCAREVRLLVMVVALAVGQAYWGLVAAAVMAHGATLANLVAVRTRLAE